MGPGLGTDVPSLSRVDLDLVEVTGILLSQCLYQESSSNSRVILLLH